MIDWIHAGPPALAAFLASLVEFVEAFTIVLAVGTVRGWRSALTGVFVAIAVLTGVVLTVGPGLERLPLSALRLGIGLLLLLFGMRWLRKSMLRAAGIIALHDETVAFATESQTLRTRPGHATRFDTAGALTAFNGVLIEGIEVVFIVLAAGAAGQALLPAAVGAAAAGVVVMLLGVALRTPLTRIPENQLKLAVGVLLTAFGTFWIGEGLGYIWPGGDLAIIALVALYIGTALTGAAFARRVAHQ
jgi:uncharacterized membrane protein